MAKTCNVALIGQGFMGRTHSNAYLKVAKFFKLPVKPVMHTVFGMKEEDPQAFADRWGWQNSSTDWKSVIHNENIDYVDVVTPNFMHMPPAMEALDAGKPVGCEKPIAGTLDDARAMVEAAKKAKVPTFVWYNYRRCPAIAYAYQMARGGALGQIRHVRGFYLQDWADASVPLLWRFDGKVSGSGSHGDLCAHTIDMVRFVTGEEIVEITGAMFDTFVKERTMVTKVSGGVIASNVAGAEGTKVPVTVDDAVLFLARFRKGAVASFEATRLATGYKNRNGFEIHGEKGALRFNMMDPNYLYAYDATEPEADLGGRRGWTQIECLQRYPKPSILPSPKLPIGWMRFHLHSEFDFLTAIAEKRLGTVTLFDGAKVQYIDEAIRASADSGQWEDVEI